MIDRILGRLNWITASSVLAGWYLPDSKFQASMIFADRLMDLRNMEDPCLIIWTNRSILLSVKLAERLCGRMVKASPGKRMVKLSSLAFYLLTRMI